MKKPTKAVIPVAGLGTRFLPATKSIPKEMLTIVDAPIIFYVIEEAIHAGIQDIVLIQGRGKTAIEDFFDTSYELEDKLMRDNKYYLLDRLNEIRNKVNIISIRQKHPLGLGHAVLCAQPVLGNEPFAVLLGDEIMLPQAPHEDYTTAELSKAFEATGHSTVAIMSIQEVDVQKYGIVDFGGRLPQEFPARVAGFVEKPNLNNAPSLWALPGRYIFSSSILDELKNQKPGKLGEIQLTDAMNSLSKKEPVYALPTRNIRYDAGDKVGYPIANIEIGLRHPDVGPFLRNYLQNQLPLLLKQTARPS
ncbi:MAG: UTP--glucose-1-phosphate uridylyltransferase [Bdellovibrionaceae bacterium]|nr:UTP--glucose-1-phosphate uridylyltransferase [Pseudobdellovibrionaceae bacterium]MDW8189757.1 UTP--glucose-1-phosphate uridylyltransferase [Pseudobdellovibrionaceae bacterium]